MRVTYGLVLIGTLTVVTSWTSGQALPFFSGAEGFGGSFLGTPPAAGWFSNATVYHVTNLNDSGPGSLRNAFVENSSNKIIIFDVGGTIKLTSGSLDIKNLSNYYIAGQTAPSPVTIYGNTVQITHSSDKMNTNVILRYLTFRKGTGDGEDALTVAGGNATGVATHMMIDHVSTSWSEDEVLSVSNYNTNITIQYSIISDALVSNHAYGSLIRPRIDSNVTLHHNLYANNASRNPRLGTYDAYKLTVDVRNNVIYNWRDRATYAGGSSEGNLEYVDVNYVGNYLIAGPATTSNATKAFIADRYAVVRAYQSGNFIDSDRQVNPGGVPNGSDTGWNMWAVASSSSPVGVIVQMSTPFSMPAVTTQAAIDAYWQVIQYAGNFWWSRDSIDSRIINNVLTNTNPPGGVGASAPSTTELNAVLNAPMTSHPAGWDTDNDGMPDYWEIAHGLNPNSASDWNQDFDNDGYINLIEYINERGEFPAPAPIVFTGAADSRYAKIFNWKTLDPVTGGSYWQPSKYDEARIDSGTAVVDAVGQHARVLKVASSNGNTAGLNVTAGWLKVEDTLSVGGAGTGTVNHSGGTVFAEVVVLGVSAGSSGTYNLSGTGYLRTGVLTKGVGNAAFNFVGGTLSADVVGMNLVNQGGVIAPGESIGTMHVLGDLTITAGTLTLEIGGTAAGMYDRIVVDGTLQAGGTLRVTWVGGFEPAAGDSFDVLDFADASGTFTLDLPSLREGLVWNTRDLLTSGVLRVTAPPALLGDTNEDGVVDLADYNNVVNNLGAAGYGVLGDTNYDGIVDLADYNNVVNNLGARLGGMVSVPEPATWVGMGLWWGWMMGGRRKRV